jgi:hypothetical protein
VSSHIHPPQSLPTISPVLTSCTGMAHLFQLVSQYWHIAVVYIRVTLGVVHSMGFDKYMMTNDMFHHYSCFIAPKCSVLHLFIPPTLWIPSNHDIFTLSLVLAFPECHLFEIIQYLAFSEWLHPLGCIHLRVLQAFSWLDSLFLFITK